MSQTDTIQVGIDKETENYAVYESADGSAIVGMYVSEGAAESVGEFGAVTISDESEVTATLDKTTKNYGVYSTEGGAVSGMYVSHDLLAEVGGESTEEGFDAPESIGLTIAPSDEGDFEEAQGVDEEEEDALVSGDSSDSDESESTDEEDEEVEISDEEVGLVDAE